MDIVSQTPHFALFPVSVVQHLERSVCARNFASRDVTRVTLQSELKGGDEFGVTLAL
jgi:hypothetical protein